MESATPNTDLPTATILSTGSTATHIGATHIEGVGKTSIQESTATLSDPGATSEALVSSSDKDSSSLKQTDTAADSAGSNISSISQDEANTKKLTKIGLQRAYLDLATVKTTPELKSLSYQGINRQPSAPTASDSEPSLEIDKQGDNVRNCSTDPSQESVSKDKELGSDKSYKDLEGQRVVTNKDGPTETDSELAHFSEGDTCISLTEKENIPPTQDLCSSEDMNPNNAPEKLEPNSNKLPAELSSKNEKGDEANVAHEIDKDPPRLLSNSTNTSTVSLPHDQQENTNVEEGQLERIQKMSGETTRDIQRLLQTIRIVNEPFSLPTDQAVSEPVDESSLKSSESSSKSSGHQQSGIVGDAVVQAALSVSEEVEEELVLEEVYQPSNSAKVDDSKVVVVGEIVGGASLDGIGNVMADSANSEVMEPVAPTDDVSEQTLQAPATVTDSATVELVEPEALSKEDSKMILQPLVKEEDLESVEDVPCDEEAEGSDSTQACQSTSKRHKFHLAASFKQ